MSPEAAELPGLGEKVGWLAGWLSFHQLDAGNKSVASAHV